MIHEKRLKLMIEHIFLESKVPSDRRHFLYDWLRSTIGNVRLSTSGSSVHRQVALLKWKKLVKVGK